MDELESRASVPLVCVTDGQHHIRTFLREALSEFRFTIYECIEPRELSDALDARPPDLVILGLTAGGMGAGEMLRALATKDFDGRVLPFAQRDSAVLEAIQGLAERLGISLLPPLLMPFNKQRLRQSLAVLLPEGTSGPLLDMAEAVRAGWLELWYQPKIDTRAIVMRGAEALLRVRHPAWGIIPPAYLVPCDSDPRFPPLSDSVISCAVEDWYYFFAQHGPIETAINLPLTFLQEPASIGRLCKLLPNHTAFEGLIVEINGTEIVRNLSLAKDVANQLRLHKIAISIDDLGAEWLSLTGLCNFPFVEIKVDQKFITGCAEDRLKQSICRRILDLADGYGARTVAEGVETWADFLAVRDMGFDLAQGFLFAKPMSAQKFALTCWAGTPTCLPPARSRPMGELGFTGHPTNIALSGVVR
jgi:EAL domain-containing protein (putative c-di-GMP-specific phosphodiesterase class I)/CheY-like chemotaxis protein